MNALALLDDIPLDVLDEAADLAAAYRSFPEFARQFWTIARPGHDPVWDWRFDYTCERTQAVLERGWGTLVMCEPVRSGKSTRYLVLANAWDWLHRPHRQWLTISKSGFNATRDSRLTRKVITSDRYLRLAELAGVRALVELDPSQREKTNFALAGGGQRQTRTNGADTTGADADVLGIDDPNDASDAEVGTPQQVARRFDETLTRHDEVWTDRLNPQPGLVGHEPGIRILSAQRLYPRDLPGVMMERARGGAPDIEVIVIPEEFDRNHPDAEFFAPVDPRTKQGEFLNPKLCGPARKAATVSRRRGERKWATRHNQRPSAPEGTKILRSWFDTRYDMSPEAKANDCADLIITCDPAGFEEVVGNDYTVIDVWGRVGEFYFLIHQARGQWGIGRIEREFYAVCERFQKAQLRLVEKTSNGLLLIPRAAQKGFAVRTVSPSVGGGKPTEGQAKEIRAQEFILAAEAGRVVLPSSAVAPWIDNVLDEYVAFGGGGGNDDRVDTAAYAVAHFEGRARMGGGTFTYRRR